jgi:hypothetical protein
MRQKATKRLRRGAFSAIILLFGHTFSLDGFAADMNSQFTEEITEPLDVSGTAYPPQCNYPRFRSCAQFQAYWDKVFKAGDQRTYYQCPYPQAARECWPSSSRNIKCRKGRTSLDLIGFHDFLIRVYRNAGNSGDWAGHTHERKLWAYADAITIDPLFAIKKRKEITRLVSNLNLDMIFYLGMILQKHSTESEVSKWMAETTGVVNECKFLGKPYSTKLTLLKKAYIDRE